MAVKNGPQTGLMVLANPGEGHYNDLTRFQRWVDWFLNPRVTSNVLLTPPGAPVDGEAYIIPTTGTLTGAWVGKAGQIARWSTDIATPGWEYYIPKEGHCLVYCILDKLRYFYNGTIWVVFSSGSGSGGGDTTPVGHLGFFWETVAPDGYLPADGGTIGNASSGATVRANADALDLFTHFWAKGNDTNCPIQTSAGAASTRGASAAVDWAASKRMTLPDIRNEFVRGSSATNVMGTKFTDAIKDHTHTFPYYGAPSGGGGSGLTSTTTGAPAGSITTAATTGSAETRPRGISLLACWKYKNVNAVDVSDGTLAVSQGGTGANDAANARANLGAKKEGTRFKARLAATSGFTSGSTIKPNLATEDWDVGGYYDNTINYRWTPPAGDYHVSAIASFSAAGLSVADLYLFVNDVRVAVLGDIRTGGSSTTTDITLSGSTDLRLNGTDYVEIKVYMIFASGTGTLAASMSGHYIGG